MARQTYTLVVVIEGDTYYSRDECEPGGEGVSFCPGEWRNLHKRSELKLGCEKQDYVVLPLFQELSYSKYFTYINLFNFPKALQGGYSSHPHRKLNNRELTCSVSPIQGNVELGFEPLLLTLICWDYGTEWGQEVCGGHSGLRQQHGQRPRGVREHGMFVILFCVSMGKQHRPLIIQASFFFQHRGFVPPPLPTEDIRKGICQHHFLKSECFSNGCCPTVHPAELLGEGCLKCISRRRMHISWFPIILEVDLFYCYLGLKLQDWFPLNTAFPGGNYWA